MRHHSIGMGLVLVALVWGVVLLPSPPTLTGATFVKARLSQPVSKRTIMESYQGVDCTTTPYKYTISIKSEAECSAKTHPYTCIARCTLAVTNQQDTAGNYTFEMTFSWKNKTRVEQQKKWLQPLARTKYLFSFPYTTSDVQQAPSCTFKPLRIPEQITCTPVTRTRRLP